MPGLEITLTDIIDLKDRNSIKYNYKRLSHSI